MLRRFVRFFFVFKFIFFFVIAILIIQSFPLPLGLNTINWIKDVIEAFFQVILLIVRGKLVNIKKILIRHNRKSAKFTVTFENRTFQ